MSDEDFWCLSYREIRALCKVHNNTLKRWAIQTAALYNSSYSTDGVLWLPEDFIGRGNREKRLQERKAQGMQDKMGLMLAQARQQATFENLQRGIVPADLPDWAFGVKGRPANG